MKKSTKVLGIGAGIAAVSLLGAYAFAQQGPGFGPGRMGMGPGMMKGMGPGMMGQGHGPAMGNFGDPAARLAAVKTELGIKPEQNVAWDAYAKTVTDTAAAMRTHRDHVNPDTVRKMEPKEREAFATTVQKQQQESQAMVKAAAETLLGKLDADQQAKARQSLPGLVAAGPGQGMRFGMKGGPGMGPGMGPPWAR